MEAAPAEPMSLQQLEAFLARAQGDPSLERPLATAPDAATVAAIAHAAGFAVTEEDLLQAAGEPPEVLEVIEILAVPQDEPQAELDAFLQQVELDPDLQRVLASAPDAEGVAALARVAGFGVTADDVWEASDEVPEALEVVTYTVVLEANDTDAAGFADGADVAAAEADPRVVAPGPETEALEDPMPVALEAFLRQAEVDPDLQEALTTAADAAAVAEIARGAGFDVAEEDLWGASDETPEALKEPPLDPPPAPVLSDPWEGEETPAQKA